MNGKLVPSEPLFAQKIALIELATAENNMKNVHPLANGKIDTKLVIREIYANNFNARRIKSCISLVHTKHNLKSD